MRRHFLSLLIAIFFISNLAYAAESVKEYRRLPVSTYVDKMAAGWAGQMIGVGWGAPTEFKSNGAILPENRVPNWQPAMINQFNQDDIYVEMTFLRSMELYGLDVPIRQAGIDFANSGYRLWHANRAGRDNLRSGIAPPDSGHPKYNSHADDIDYQIEADFSGLIAPGSPNVAIRLGETFGRLMNYGDGLYGGQFVAGMYATAFFEDDPIKIIEAGLACIPAESQYAETIRDVLRWHKENPSDWQANWQKIEEKYQKNPEYRRFSCSHGDFNIDAKINGAYIIMGLLYGERDIEKTTVIAMRCGQDSDCNPSSATGILCTTIGMNAMPEKYVGQLNHETIYSHTAYNFDSLKAVCEQLARQAVVAAGGRIEKEADGTETFVIPVVAPKPTALEQCWEAGPSAESRFTEEEMAKIKEPVATSTGSTKSCASAVDLSEAIAKFAPGWSIKDCGCDMDPGMKNEWAGKSNVLMTHPMSTTKPCVISRKIDIPAGKKTKLVLDVSYDTRGDWTLIVKAGEQELAKKKISAASTLEGWATIEIDLSPLAGKTVNLQLENAADGWKWEAAFWSNIQLVSE